MSKARELSNWLPAGGNAGDALVKASAADFDFTYAPNAGGGGTGLPPFAFADRGKALVVGPLGQSADWGNDINSADQTINAGSF